jgi:hypothetical protein
METRSKATLAARKEAYRLWFEYLKVALQCPDKKVKAALLVSEPYYRPWQMDVTVRFDKWWAEHQTLFDEKYIVRELAHGEKAKDPNALLLEVPLTQSPTILTRKVKAIVQAAFERQAKTERKGKSKATAYYHLTEGAEPKLDAVREMLSIYRDVYLKNPKLRGEKLLDAVHKYYTNRKNKKWARIPMAFQHDGGDDKERAMRNLRRYIQKAQTVVLNVARGQFPGEY